MQLNLQKLENYDFVALDGLRISLGLTIADICYEGRINRSCYFRWQQHYKGSDKGAKPHAKSLEKMRKALIALQNASDPDPPPEEEEGEPPILEYIQKTAAE